VFYAVLFEDDTTLGADVRSRHMSAHLTFLEANAARIKSAGPLTSSGGAVGGLWLVDAESPDIVDRLVKADPLWPTGLRRSVRILGWSRVFADGRRLIDSAAKD
jgi:uncharacterized protein